jgi:hypothetical protein
MVTAPQAKQALDEHYVVSPVCPTEAHGGIDIVSVLVSGTFRKLHLVGHVILPEFEHPFHAIPR